MIKAVIFDLDNTLYDFTRADRIALKGLCKYARENFGLDDRTFLSTFGEARRTVKTRLREGAALHNRVLFLQTALEMLEINPFEHVLELYEIYWGTFLDVMVLYDGAREFLERLKSEGYRTAICTDMTSHIQYRKIKRFGLERLIDVIVTCEETGVEKPSAAMFEMSLSKLGVRAEEAAMVGDSLDRDVEGAARVGLMPIWYVGDRVVDESIDKYIRIKSYREPQLLNIFFPPTRPLKG